MRSMKTISHLTNPLIQKNYKPHISLAYGDNKLQTLHFTIAAYVDQ